MRHATTPRAGHLGRFVTWPISKALPIQATTGSVVDLATGGVAPFRHRPVPSAVVAVHGSVLASMLVDPRSGLRGFIVDVDRDSPSVVVAVAR